MRDVIVIGAGGSGAVVAKELAGQGLDVLVLEGGPRFAHPRQEWSLLENDANNIVSGYLRVGPSDRTKSQWFRDLPQEAYLWQVAGVGGSTLSYYANCPRAYPGVFTGYSGADAANYDLAHLFPFTYQELVPYYQWVEATLPVQTAAMGTKDALFLRGCETLGLPVQTTKTTTTASFRPQENAILQPGGQAGLTTDLSLLSYPTSTGCTFCGHCEQGCMQPISVPRNLTAKRSTDNSYVPMALTADAWARHGKPVTLVADAQVTQIRTAMVGGKLTAAGVTWRGTRTGETHTEDARVVVMAGGAIESPRLWFNSGLPNPNDAVGRGFTDHYMDWLIGIFDEDTGNTRGPSSSARSDFPGYGAVQNAGYGPSIGALSMCFSDSGVRNMYTNGRGLTGSWDGPTGRIVGPELKAVMRNGIDRILNAMVLTDDDVLSTNRINLSSLPPDENGGMPRVEIHQRQRSARSVRNREYLVQQGVALLRGAGAQTVYRMDFAPVMLHVHSTMRMGLSASDTVVDANAEARWVRRLFIADNSVLANSVGGVNPTLTTQALATRTAEKIVQRYFDGQQWVRQQTPVVSTDSRITTRMAQLGL
jgi:choline dehydrogenase-like flavoprotein